MAKLLHFSLEKEYGGDKWRFENRKEKLDALQHAFKEYAMINDLPYRSGMVMVIGEINEVGVDDENCLFGRIDYSKTTYSIQVKVMAYVNNDKDAEYWKKRFSEEIA